MKNLIKFLFFVLLVSAAISALYDYRLKTGGLNFLASTAEKYSLATAPSVDPKDVAGLENLNRERRALVSSIIPSVVSIKTSKKVPVRRQYQLDPSDFFNRNPRQFRNPNDEALVQNSLGSGVVVLGSAQDGKVALIVGVTKDLTNRVQAGKIIKPVAEKVGGSGGGRPDMAEAGGKDPGKLDAALSEAYSAVAALLS